MGYIEILRGIRPELEKLYELGCGRVVIQLEVSEVGFDKVHRELMDDMVANNSPEKNQSGIDMVIEIEHNREFDKKEVV